MPFIVVDLLQYAGYCGQRDPVSRYMLPWLVVTAQYSRTSLPSLTYTVPYVTMVKSLPHTITVPSHGKRPMCRTVEHRGCYRDYL